jgi:hypothetical protein
MPLCRYCDDTAYIKPGRIDDEGAEKLVGRLCLFCMKGQQTAFEMSEEDFDKATKLD